MKEAGLGQGSRRFLAGPGHAAWARLLALRVEKDASGKVTGLTALFDNGRSNPLPRTEG